MPRAAMALTQQVLINVDNIAACLLLMCSCIFRNTTISGVIFDMPQCRVKYHSLSLANQMFRSSTVRLSIEYRGGMDRGMMALERETLII